MNIKKCSMCKEQKELSEFNKEKTRADGHAYVCKCCSKKLGKIYREKHPKSSNERSNKWQKENREKCAERRKQSRINNPEKVRERERTAKAKWAARFPEKARAIAKRQYRKMMDTDAGKLKTYVRTAVRKSIRELKNGRHWESLVGYTLAELKKHLEMQFTPEMNWDNYGSYWHIDHKIPVAAFNFNAPDEIDFRRCWALKNLQPLEAVKNLRKSDTVNIPFQPSLTLVA